MPKLRSTKRVAFIREILHKYYGGGPVLLSELRWRVRRAERGAERGHSRSRSAENSFNTTLRAMRSELRRSRLSPGARIPVGLASREGLFRLRSTVMSSGFLSSDRPFVAFRWIARKAEDRPIVYPELSYWSGSPEEPSTARCFGHVNLNLGRGIVVVHTRPITPSKMTSLSQQPWSFRYLKHWSPTRLNYPSNSFEWHIRELPMSEFIDWSPWNQTSGRYMFWGLPDDIALLPLRPQTDADGHYRAKQDLELDITPL